MKEYSLYGGAMPQGAQANPSLAAQAGASGDFGRTIGSALAQFGGAIEKNVQGFFKMSDYEAMTSYKSKLQKVQDERDLEMRKRLAIPYGQNGSFFDESGRFKEDEFALFNKQSYDAYQGVARPIMYTPEANVQSSGIYSDVTSGIATRYGALVLEHKTQTAKEALNTRVKYHVANGDYNGASDEFIQGGEGGVISPAEAELGATMMRQEGLYKSAEGRLMSDPIGLSLDIEDGVYDDLPPDQKNKLDRASRAEIYRSTPRFTSRVNGKLQEVTMPPAGLPENLNYLWLENNGKFDGDLQAQNKAREGLSKYCRNLITKADDPDEADRVRSYYKQFGLSDQYASAMITQWQDEYKQLSAWNPKTTLDHAEGMGWLTRKHDQYINSLEKEKDTYMGSDSKEDKKLWTIEKETELKAAKEARGAHVSAARENALSSYDEWIYDYKLKNDGKEPRNVEKVAAFNDTMTDVLLTMNKDAESAVQMKAKVFQGRKEIKELGIRIQSAQERGDEDLLKRLQGELKDKEADQVEYEANAYDVDPEFSYYLKDSIERAERNDSRIYDINNKKKKELQEAVTVQYKKPTYQDLDISGQNGSITPVHDRLTDPVIYLNEGGEHKDGEWVSVTLPNKRSTFARVAISNEAHGFNRALTRVLGLSKDSPYKTARIKKVDQPVLNGIEEQIETAVPMSQVYDENGMPLDGSYSDSSLLPPL